MTTASITNNYLTKAMQQGIRGFEKNGFTARRIMPVDPMAGIHAREFHADFAKQTPTGLLVFSVRIDTDGNVTNPKPKPNTTMNKLYYIVCDDKETNVFEGRYQGRTRGEALKFLKQTIGRKTLNGLVFTITEIPVPLIREIVAEILAGGDGSKVALAANVVPIARPEATPGRYDAFADAAEPEPTPAETTLPKASKAKASKPAKKVGNPGHGDEQWSQVKAYWLECRSVKQTAEHFGLSPNSIKTRSRREGWGK